MKNRYKNIPEEMKVLKRFVGWKREELNGKTAKLPYSLIDGQSRDWNREERWVDFKVAKEHHCPFGFVLTDEDEIICVDLDKAIRDGKLTELAQKVVAKFSGTYMEISQSDRGLHVFVKGKILNNLNLSSQGIEIYKNNRYIALTGNIGDGELFPRSNKLLYLQTELDELYKKWTQEKPSINQQIHKFRNQKVESNFSFNFLTTDEILMTMYKTNKKARQLISGESLTGDHSRDDFIFLVLARNYTDGNPDLMKELLLMTPLNRLGSQEKRKDDHKYLEYLENSIEKVLELGNYKPFDWSKHLEYKRRVKAYGRF